MNQNEITSMIFAYAIGVAVYVFLYHVVKRRVVSLIKRGKTTHARILGFLTAITGFIGVFAFNGAMSQIEKEKDEVYAKIVASPSDKAVDELIDLLRCCGCENHPNAWNKLRSIWITFNESPNVSTEKKKQLKQFLMLQGLTMHYQDSKIIDNCKL